jgi:hypothetical protein
MKCVTLGTRSIGPVATEPSERAARGAGKQGVLYFNEV